MVAAGLDTLPGNINMTIAYLSSAHGQEIQARMYDEIIKSYPGEDPWHACLIEEKSEFIVSFVKVSGSDRARQQNLMIHRRCFASGLP